MVQVFNTYLKEGKPVLEEERKLPADIHCQNEIKN